MYGKPVLFSRARFHSRPACRCVDALCVRPLSLLFQSDCSVHYFFQFQVPSSSPRGPYAPADLCALDRDSLDRGSAGLSADYFWMGSPAIYVGAPGACRRDGNLCDWKTMDVESPTSRGSA